MKSVWRSCFTASTKLFDNKNEDTDQTVEEASVIGNQMEQMYGTLETREDADATIAIADDEAVNEFENMCNYLQIRQIGTNWLFIWIQFGVNSTAF